MLLKLVNVKDSRALYDELSKITKVSVTDLESVVYVCCENYELLVLATCLLYGDVVES